MQTHTRHTGEGLWRSGMRVAIVGATGGIGAALCAKLAARTDIDQIYAISRSGPSPIAADITPITADLLDEASLAKAAIELKAGGPLDRVIVATGVLSDNTGKIGPEKSWREQTLPALEYVFAVNTFGPALVAKHFLPLLTRKRLSVFAVLSARVGSITDNRLGGWHAYRASKAALNMLIKNYALELARRNDQAIAVSLHPGTVATQLSERFTRSANRTVFSPEQAAAYLLEVIENLTPADSGKTIDWAGKEIPP